MFKPPRRAARSAARRGQALLEFVFVSVVLLGMAAAALTLGYFLYCAQSLQMFADVAAQEISRFPAEPGDTLRLGDPTLDRTAFKPGADDAPLALDPEFSETVYDERHLLLDPEVYRACLDGTGPALPVVNRLVLPLFIFDPTFTLDGSKDRGVMRYPGAIVENKATGALTVLVPILEYGTDGSETLVRWVAPIEEVLADGESLYPVRTSDPSDKRSVSGVVALRMNYPAQSGMTVNRVAVDEKTLAVQVADDNRLANGESLGKTGGFKNYELVVGANAGGFSPEGVVESRAHAGRFGLGRQAAHLEQLGVRPYRKVLAAQAVYRRELFGTGG